VGWEAVTADFTASVKSWAGSGEAAAAARRSAARSFIEEDSTFGISESDVQEGK
jgi:hypothetical protein